MHFEINISKQKSLFPKVGITIFVYLYLSRNASERFRGSSLKCLPVTTLTTETGSITVAACITAGVTKFLRFSWSAKWKSIAKTLSVIVAQGRRWDFGIPKLSSDDRYHRMADTTQVVPKCVQNANCGGCHSNDIGCHSPARQIVTPIHLAFKGIV